ncbi:DNA-3-methyladenine glycosylase family protein [Cellulomonas algicola]|uniref:DNA-3-methyladenine glycosylase family protein n=1 Tax=Cellulomonas algicola TaxID=2071633 RepID=UPI0027DFA35F|nr:AlkA N-terminal domain-containing protein [Cellulomonas algicola]
MTALPPLGPPHAWTVHAAVDPAPLLASLRAHAVPGVETVDGSTVCRLVPVGTRLVPVAADLHDGHVVVRGAAPTTVLDDVARRWFGLDDDVDAVADVLAQDAVVGPLARRRPHLRVLGHLDGFEATVTTVLGQQVSLAAARTFGGRLAAAWGRPGPDGLLAFPRPDDLADLDPAEIQSTVRITHARARSLRAVAEAFADGLDLHPGADPVEARRRLLALPGVGPWTVEYLALRVLADRDALPAGDVVLRRALGVDSTAAVEAASAHWRPWRAYAAIHLWTSRAYAL